jgi:hypothetical protein
VSHQHRFRGFVEKIGDGIDVAKMRDWVVSIPLSEWPSAPKPTLDPYIVGLPAIVNTPAWHDFEKQSAAMMLQLGTLDIPDLRGKRCYNFMISTLVPMQFLGTHWHGIGPDMERWCFRVHVPIKTNPSAFLIMDQAYHLEVGSAYKVNVERHHAVVNHGEDSRIHFMFEVDHV